MSGLTTDKMVGNNTRRIAMKFQNERARRLNVQKSGMPFEVKTEKITDKPEKTLLQKFLNLFKWQD